jgi:hypothetical protein
LFIESDFDQVCTIIDNRQGNPMREACLEHTVVSLPAGHWRPLERGAEHVESVRIWPRAV